MNHDKHMPTVLSIMTPFPHHIDARATLTEAQQLMEKHGIHHLPVKVQGSIDSIISQRDILRARLVGHRTRPDEEMLVADFCQPRAFFANINDPLDKILTVMADKHIGAVLVLKEGTLTGIMTYSDVARAYCAQLLELFPPPDDGGDAAA